MLYADTELAAFESRLSITFSYREEWHLTVCAIWWNLNATLLSRAPLDLWNGVVHQRLHNASGHPKKKQKDRKWWRNDIGNKTSEDLHKKSPQSCKIMHQMNKVPFHHVLIYDQWHHRNRDNPSRWIKDVGDLRVLQQPERQTNKQIDRYT